MDTITELSKIYHDVQSCRKCELCKDINNRVLSRGFGYKGVMFIGEGPGADEDADGIPFCGKSGKLLDKMIEAMGFIKEEIFIANIVKCRPPNNRKPTPQEMKACKPFLIQQIEIMRPEVIVTLGATAIEGLLGSGFGITKRRGKWEYLFVQDDSLDEGGYTIPVMPTFHPAACFYNPELKHDVWIDLQEVMKYI